MDDIHTERALYRAVSQALTARPLSEIPHDIFGDSPGVGYSMSDHVYEDRSLWCLGNGANGKSVAYLRRVMAAR